MFCARPYTHIYNDIDGTYRLCCYAKPITDATLQGKYTIHTTTPIQFFKSPFMKQIRKEFASGNIEDLSSETKRICSHCIQLSPQQRLDSLRGITTPIKQQLLHVDEQIEGRYIHMKLRLFGNECNLSCVMCYPNNSNTRQNELQKIKLISNTDYMSLKFFANYEQRANESISNERLEEILEELTDYSKHISIFEIIGGEPFLLKQHIPMIDRLIETGESKNIVLKYSTNLTLYKHWESLIIKECQNFKEVNFGVSIDSVGEKNDYIRWGSDWDKLLHNIDSLKELQKQYPNITISFSITVTRLNWKEVPELVSIIKKRYGPKSHVTLNMVRSPGILSLLSCSDEEKQQITEMYFRANKLLFEKAIEFVDSDFDMRDCTGDLKNYLSDLDKIRGTDYRQIFSNYEFAN
jgi:sulfatase maturation enzyme AslB (radical SAM superfamily)